MRLLSFGGLEINANYDQVMFLSSGYLAINFIVLNVCKTRMSNQCGCEGLSASSLVLKLGPIYNSKS